MKIVIFEKEHFEGAFPVIKLFDKPGNEVSILTSPETHKRFADLLGDHAGRYTWTILPSTGKLSFFYALYKHLRKQSPDLLYINTISDNHILYAFVLQLLGLKRTVLTVHDINCLFESRPSLHPRKAIVHWGKKWLTRHIHEFNVVADTMIPQLQVKVKNRQVHNIPGAVFENRHSPQSTGTPWRLVVPGSLDKRRRDYEQVFHLAAFADQQRLPLQIILLGGYFDEKGKAITLRADAFESAFAKIISYETTIVDQEEFDRQLDAAHFVFIPSVVETHICGNIPETYGITKSSGNIFDVIKHAKPFIVPERLMISPDLEGSCFKYRDTRNITSFLQQIMQHPAEYERWQDKALQNSKKFTIDKVRGRNAALFNAESSQQGNVL